MIQWHLARAPWPVQTAALEYSDGHDRFAWFMEQGLGKTATALNDLINHLDRVPGMVVIAPQSFKLDWLVEAREWGLSDDRWSLGYWPRHPFPVPPFTKPFVYAINYEAARTSAGKRIDELINKHPMMLTVDETSNLKNPQSLQTKAVLDFGKGAKIVRALNGTPFTETVLDLWAQLKLVGGIPGVNSYQFRNRYAEKGGFMGRQLIGVKNEDELYKIQAACSFRALKKDWRPGMPPKLSPPIRLEMTNRQRKHYEEMFEYFITVARGVEVDAPIVLTQLDKLRQIVSGLLLKDGQEILIEEPSKNPKIRAALDVYEAGTGKMIIVHYYTAMGKVIFDVMDKVGLQPAFIRGNMEPEELQQQKLRFNNDPNCRILVAQIKAAHLGHTLIGQPGNNRVNRMFFHDNTFSYYQRVQMEDRIHRSEADQDCLYYTPVMSQVDEWQLEALARKDDMANFVVNKIRALRNDQRTC